MPYVVNICMSDDIHDHTTTTKRTKRTEHQYQSQKMVSYPDDDEQLVTSTVPFLQGVALEYKSTLDILMSYFHGVDYAREREYTKGELRALTPDDVVAWMNVKAFDDPDPSLDANPTEFHSSSLEFWKKTLSFFMPDRLTALVSGRNEGNPTRSIEVNSLIRRVKKKEVRKQGRLCRSNVH